jgi:hypothetical protein
MEQDLSKFDVAKLHPLSPEIIYLDRGMYDILMATMLNELLSWMEHCI